MRRLWLAMVSVACAGLLWACGTAAVDRSPAGGATPDIWETLRARPLAVPAADGGRCPVAVARRVSPDLGPALGDGPVYAVFGAGSVFRYGYGDERDGFQGEWGGEKVLWVAAPDFAGPALVRGRELDGPNEVRFGPGVDPADELRLEPDPGVIGSPSGWTNWPSYTRVRAPGCYAYQVDTPDRSYTVVFRAERAP
jgi:hypothetical protein